MQGEAGSIKPIAPVEPLGPPESSRPVELVAIERRVLAALCQGSEEGSMHERARQLLADYRWCEPVHQTLFEIVMSLPAASERAWREQLPARLTRRGFPDFDFAALFTAPLRSRLELERLMAELTRTGKKAGAPSVRPSANPIGARRNPPLGLLPRS